MIDPKLTWLIAQFSLIRDHCQGGKCKAVRGSSRFVNTSKTLIPFECTECTEINGENQCFSFLFFNWMVVIPYGDQWCRKVPQGNFHKILSKLLR
jgi:hypothetical protein